jgi:uroporphyrinogen-III synthase
MAPQHHALSILLTRPADQAARFAQDLAARFGNRLRPAVSPLMVPRFLAPDWPDAAYAALILTSETGAEAAARLRAQGRALPDRAICVGDRTAQAARAAGFSATSAQGDAEALLAHILASGDPGPFLHLRGRDARGDIAPRLSAQGCPAHAAIVYAQEAQPLTDAARHILAGHDPVVVPLFSPRTAALLAERGPFAAPLLVAAISPAAAVRAEALAPARLVTADRPDAAAMLDAVEWLISHPAS